MNIHSIGYNHPHDKNFVMDRRNGLDTWLFLLIKTPAIFLQDGKELVTKENSFILYTDKEPSYYRTFGEEYIDDWIHFMVDAGDEALFSELKLPLNRVTWLGNISELSPLIRSMTYEYYSPSPYSTDIITHYMKILFIKLSRQLHSELISPSEYDIRKHQNMVDLRTRIYNMPQAIPSVTALAEELSMSLSGFQHTYKKIFGVNVMNDVINSRLKQAKYLLATTDLTLGSIAAQCGYSNEFHLMRQFKKVMGCTPSDYRRIL
jgi:AraC family transcriptional regulator of arabinose operon